MALKTLPADVKKLFADKGITLSPEQEHVAADAQEKGAVNWTALFAAISSAVPALIQIVSAFIAAFATPAASAKKAAAGCCDHHCCCEETLKAALKTVDCASKHLCACCCED